MPPQGSPTDNRNPLQRIKHAIFGAPKHLQDTHLFHKMSLIPILAWVGLGADGLSSSAYGPEEAFKALGSHTYLALLLAVVHGADGLHHLLRLLADHRAFPPRRRRLHRRHPPARGKVGAGVGERAAGGLRDDHHHLHRFLRATPSSATCRAAIPPLQGPGRLRPHRPPDHPQHQGGQGIGDRAGTDLHGLRGHPHRHAPLRGLHPCRPLRSGGYDFGNGIQHDVSSIGIFGILLLFMRAYSLGGGTYTGIEAVSNGLQIMREPRVQTGKRTMIYMATSLAFTAGSPAHLLPSRRSKAGGRERPSTRSWPMRSSADWPMGKAIAFITIFSEGALLLLVAAQTGFVDGPRVMANMAIDSWFPHRFAALSERLTMRNGILLMGIAAIALLFYTGGSVSALVVMYSINVFITFSLSQLGMSRFFIQRRREDPQWMRHLSVHLVGLVLCVTILVITTVREVHRGGVDDAAHHLGGDRTLLPDQEPLRQGAQGDGPARRDARSTSPPAARKIPTPSTATSRPPSSSSRDTAASASIPSSPSSPPSPRPTRTSSSSRWQ